MSKKMKANIWKVTSKYIGEADPFSSEYEMEAFLMTHPNIIGCKNPDEDAFPYLFSHQLVVEKKKSKGRIDMVGLVWSKDEKKFQIKLFELKNVPIGLKEVEQIKDYLSTDASRKALIDNVKNLLSNNEKDLTRLDDTDIKGVLVGPSFDPKENILQLAQDNDISVIKITRFITEDNDTFICVEEPVGNITGGGGPKSSWRALGIDETDRLFFQIDDNTKKIWAKPVDLESKQSKKLILENYQEVITEIEKNKLKIESTCSVTEHPAMLQDYIEEIKQQNGIIGLEKATFLAYAYLQNKTQENYHRRANNWMLERDGRRIEEIRKNKLAK